MKKLLLTRETLIPLTPEALSTVDGGFLPVPGPLPKTRDITKLLSAVFCPAGGGTGAAGGTHA